MRELGKLSEHWEGGKGRVRRKRKGVNKLKESAEEGKEKGKGRECGREREGKGVREQRKRKGGAVRTSNLEQDLNQPLTTC